MDINHLTVEELKIVKDAINQKINQLGDNTSQEETLEEAAFHYSKNKINKNTSLLDFTKGAKWQAERMYSEEEVLEQLIMLMSLPSSTLDKFTDDNGNITIKWFEQFKKK
jgi:hypothetical protein